MGNETGLNQKIFKAGFWYVASQILVRGISFLTMPIYARLLSPEQLGQVTIFESWLRVFLPIMTLSLYVSVERAKYDFRECLDSYISSIQTLIVLLNLGVVLVILPFRDKVEEWMSMNDVMLAVMLLYFGTQASLNCIQRREKVMLQYKSNILISIMASVVPTVVSIGMLVWVYMSGRQEDMVKTRILSFYGLQILVGAVVILILGCRGKVFFNKEYWLYGLRFSIPLIPHVLSMEILNQSDKIMVEKMTGAYQAGIFSLATKIMWILLLLTQAVGDAWLPWIYEKLDQKDYVSIKLPWSYLIHGFGIFTWFLVMLSPELTFIMGGEQYQESIYLVAPLLSSVIAHFFGYNYIYIEQFYKKNVQIMIASMFSVFLNIMLNYICILKWGYQAAAFTTAFCYFFLILIHGCILKHATGNSVVSVKYTAGITAFYYLVNGISVKTYEWPWQIRYVFILLVICVLTVLLKKQLSQVLNYIKFIRRKTV